MAEAFARVQAGVISAAFPGRNIADSTRDMWAEVMSGYDAAAVGRVVHHLVLTLDNPPTVKQLADALRREGNDDGAVVHRSLPVPDPETGLTGYEGDDRPEVAAAQAAALARMRELGERVAKAIP